MSKIGFYKVDPFSGKSRRENEERLKDGQSPCAICGKGVNEPWPHVAVVVDGGSDWARTMDEANNKVAEREAGYMGAWPIGNECHRKHFLGYINGQGE